MGDAIKSIWLAVRGLLGMKKTWTALATLVVWLVAQFGLQLPAQEVASAVMLMAGLFVGYVLQDIGKGDVPPKTIREALFEMLSSKKFVVVLGTCIAWVITRLGLNVDPETISYVLNGATALVLGIGFQDFKKSEALTAVKRKKK
jgi:MFS superfamily sulfate permease-like transporter